MQLKNMMPVLLVSNAGKAKEFYAGVLGMTVVADFGGMNYVFKEGFAVWQPMPENIILQRLGQEKVFEAGAVSRFEICFETEELNEVHKRLKEAGVRFLHEINEELWGQRTIRFYDPDGHLIEAGESLPVFVGRIYEEEGRNIDATARRAYMQPEDVEKCLDL